MSKKSNARFFDKLLGLSFQVDALEEEVYQLSKEVMEKVKNGDVIVAEERDEISKKETKKYRGKNYNRMIRELGEYAAALKSSRDILSNALAVPLKKEKGFEDKDVMLCKISADGTEWCEGE